MRDVGCACRCAACIHTFSSILFIAYMKQVNVAMYVSIINTLFESLISFAFEINYQAREFT